METTGHWSHDALWELHRHELKESVLIWVTVTLQEMKRLPQNQSRVPRHGGPVLRWSTSERACLGGPATGAHVAEPRLALSYETLPAEEWKAVMSG